MRNIGFYCVCNYCLIVCLCSLLQAYCSVDDAPNTLYILVGNLMMWLRVLLMKCYILPCKVFFSFCYFFAFPVLQRYPPLRAAITRPSAPCATLPMPEILLTSPGLMRLVAVSERDGKMWRLRKNMHLFIYFPRWLMCALIPPAGCQRPTNQGTEGGDWQA